MTDGPKVDGVATRKVVVTGHVGVLFNWVAPKNGVVLLDGKDRARRITVSYGRESVQLDVRYSKVAADVSRSRLPRSSRRRPRRRRGRSDRSDPCAPAPTSA